MEASARIQIALSDEHKIFIWFILMFHSNFLFYNMSKVVSAPDAL
jgi:hypothetical protein